MADTADRLPAHPGAMTPPPELDDVARSISQASHVGFRLANRWLMVPLHRAGAAAWLGSPLAGWQCLLTTTGRRTGLRRDAPLGYYVADGAAWVLAGYGPRTRWYRNILADSRVVLRLPGRKPFEATAEDVTDPDVRARIIPPLIRSMGLPGVLIGCIPALASDERILRSVSFVPLVRVAPGSQPLVAGVEDPGGHGWVWRQAMLTALTVLAGALLRRVVGGARRDRAAVDDGRPLRPSPPALVAAVLLDDAGAPRISR